MKRFSAPLSILLLLPLTTGCFRSGGPSGPDGGDGPSLGPPASPTPPEGDGPQLDSRAPPDGTVGEGALDARPAPLTDAADGRQAPDGGAPAADASPGTPPPDAAVDPGPQPCAGATCLPRYIGTSRLAPLEITGRKVGGMAVNADGTSVLTGTFTGTVDFDPGPATTSLTSQGPHDHFVTVFAPDGRHAWTRALGGPATSNQAMYRVAIAADGSVAVSGYFGGTLEVRPSIPEVKLTALARAGDGYVARFAADGRVQFIRARTSLRLEACHASGVDVGPDGTTLISGECYDRADTQRTDGFAMKLDAQGQAVYSRSFVAVQGGSGVPLIRPFADGSALVAGHFDGRIDLDPGDAADVRMATGGTSSYVVRLDPRGTYVWGTTLEWSFFGENIPLISHVGPSPAGEVYVLGYFDSTKLRPVDLDPGPGRDPREGAGNVDLFVVKLNARGEYQWARSFGGPGFDIGHTVSTTSDNGVVLVGYTYSVALPFDPPGGRVANAAEHGSFVIKLSPDNRVLWAFTTGGPFSIGHRVAVGPMGMAILGQFADTGDFDPGPGFDVQPKPPTSTHYVSRFAF